MGRQALLRAARDSPELGAEARSAAFTGLELLVADDEEFADDVIEECASFPFGSNDDYVDSTTQALMRFRQGGFIKLEMDFEDEPKFKKKYEYG